MWPVSRARAVGWGSVRRSAVGASSRSEKISGVRTVHVGVSNSITAGDRRPDVGLSRSGWSRSGLGSAKWDCRRFLSSLPEHELLMFPKLSPTMESGLVSRWVIKEGEQISEGDTIAEIETDKSVMDLNANSDGFLAKILVEEGHTTDIGVPMCIVVEDDANIDAFKDYSPSGDAGTSTPEVMSEPTPEPKPEPVVAPAAPVQMELPRASSSAPDRVYASFKARLFAMENHVDLSQITGTGLFGSVTMEDVEAFMASGDFKKSTPTIDAPKLAYASPDGLYDAYEVGPIRALAAQRSVASKTQVPHFYLNVDCKVSGLLSSLESWNASLGENMDLRDVLIKACAVSLKKDPVVNSSYVPDTGKVRRWNRVDVAVEFFTEQGPVTGVVKDAASKGILAIATEVKELEAKAQAGMLTAEEQEGGAIMVSDLGGLGVTSATPLVWGNRAGALTIGAVRESVLANGDEYEVQSSINLTMSCDHRLVDGAVGALWLQQLKKCIENPMSMLL